MDKDKYGRGFNQDYFLYAPPTPVTISNASPSATSIIQIDADSSFNWIASSYLSLVAGDSFNLSPAATGDAAAAWPPMEANNLLPPVLLQIVDTGSGKYLMNTPIPLAAFFGDGKNPYRLLAPRVFAPNSSIQMNWTFAGSATRTYTIYPVLHGYKQYSA